MPRPRRKKIKRDEGTVAIIVALMLVVLIGFLGFVVDTGQIFRVRNELQNVADASALAGARMLDGTLAGVTKAEQAALDFAKKHWADGKWMQDPSVDPNDLKVEFGHWHVTDDGTYCPAGAPCWQHLGDATTITGSLAGSVNSVRVIGYRSDNINGTSAPVRHFFMPLLGNAKSDVGAEAIAIGGGPYTDCGFPMVVPDCALTNAVVQGGCEWCMQFQNNNSDTAGWTSFGENGFPIEALIASMCGTLDTGFLIDDSPGGTLECTGSCHSWSVADGDLPVFNGNSMNKNNYCGLIQEILNRDGTGVAKEFRVRVPVLKSSPGSACDASQFSSFKPISGWATVEIMGAACNNPPVVVPNPPVFCSPPPSNKFILARLRCDLDSTDIAGGGFFGTEAPHIRLVK